MKKALNLLLTYLLLVIISTILGTTFYSVYIHVTNYIPGYAVDFSTSSLILYSFFTIFPYVFILICPLLCYYRIRHVGQIWQLVFYILIAVVTWGLFYPLSIKASNHYLTGKENSFSSKTLTENHFRKDENKVYYFTKDYNPDSYTITTPGIIIDTTENGKVTYEEFGYSPDFILSKKAFPYKDILIKQNFAEKDLPIKLDIANILERTRYAYNHGITFIIGFMMFAFVLSSLFACTNIFNWKLINTVFLIFMFAAILFVNIYYFNPVLDSFKLNYIDSNSFLSMLGKYIESPLLSIINFITGLILIIVSIVSFIIKKHVDID